MIYQRQKVLLALLEAAPNKTASRLQLVKWLFLMKEEERIDRRVNFYSFFPYKYGPFSFVVYRDIAELERFGLVEPDSNILRSAVTEKSVEFKLPPSVTGSIERIVEKYGKLPQRSLVRYVYEKHPWYACRSGGKESDSSAGSPRAYPAIYSLGYEGLSIDAFLDVILRAGMQTVIDSRSNPISRKYGFSKSALADRCSDVEVKYYHFSEIGIPSKIRRQIQDRPILWDLYTQEILLKNSRALESIARICMNVPSVLICFEKKPEDCHRHMAARELSTRTELPVVHYVEGRWEKDGRAYRGTHNSQDVPYTVEQI